MEQIVARTLQDFELSKREESATGPITAVR